MLSAPTTGHGWCMDGLLMVPASSMHGGSHHLVAGATGACLHARWCVSCSACSPAGAPAPRPASHPMGWVLGLCTSAP